MRVLVWVVGDSLDLSCGITGLLAWVVMLALCVVCDTEWFSVICLGRFVVE